MILDYFGDNSYNSMNTGGLLGNIMGISIALWILILLFNIFQIIGMWKLFKRFNKPAWASLIPLYNYYIMCDITELPKYYVALLIIPIANIYILYKIYNELTKKCEKPNWYTFGLLFLPYIFIPIIGFDINLSKSDKKNKPETDTENEQINEASQIINKEEEYVAPTFESDFNNVNNNDFNQFNNHEDNNDIFNNSSPKSDINQVDDTSNENFTVSNNLSDEVKNNSNEENKLPSVGEVIQNKSEEEKDNNEKNKLPSVGEVIQNKSEEEKDNNEENKLPSVGEVIQNKSEEEKDNNEENKLPSVGEVINNKPVDVENNQNNDTGNTNNYDDSISKVSISGETNPFIDNLIAQNISKKQNDVNNTEHKELKDFGMENNLSDDNPFSPKPNNENIVSEEYF